MTGGTLAEQNSPRVRQDVQRILTAIVDARPDSPGIDDLEALSVAADAARAAGDPHAELVLIDSGLDDRGALDFTEPGMLAATPAEVAQQLKASGNLPDLRGFTVLLVGLGYTAPPQAPLSAKWRCGVTRIWGTVVTAAGAKDEIIPQPGQGPSVDTDQLVKAVPVPPTQPVLVPPAPRGKPHKPTIVIFTQESAVRFEPNTTVFVDPAAAKQALTPIAKWLAADPSRHARLEGTTADVGPMSGQIELSKRGQTRSRRVDRPRRLSHTDLDHGSRKQFPPVHARPECIRGPARRSCGAQPVGPHHAELSLRRLVSPALQPRSSSRLRLKDQTQ